MCDDRDPELLNLIFFLLLQSKNRAESQSQESYVFVQNALLNI